MKTSNKLLLAAIMVIILSIGYYDTKLFAIYKSGDYKKVVYEYKTLDFKNFDVLDINASGQANVKIVQGPFQVKISTAGAQNYTTVKQVGSHLQIDVSMPMRSYDHNDYIVLVSCPTLKTINADDSYFLNHKKVVDTTASQDAWYRKIAVQGFKLDSLSIHQSNGSYLILANNQISNLKAKVGESDKSESFIDVSKNNKLQQGNIDIQNKSTMLINNGLIKSIKYEVADSAKVVIIGAMRK